MNATPGIQYVRFDASQAAAHLTVLDPRPDARFTFQALDHDKARDLRALCRVLHGSLNDALPALVQAQMAGAAVYVCLHETDLYGRKNTNIVRPRCWAADSDGAPPENLDRLPLLPSLVIESSPGRWWAVWMRTDPPIITTEAQRETENSGFNYTQTRLATLFDSDPKVTSLSRVMRLAGFRSRWEPPFMARVLYRNPEARYSCAEFDAALTAALAKHKPDYREVPKAAPVPSPVATRKTAYGRHSVGAALVPPAPAWTPYEDARIRTALAFRRSDGVRVWDPDADREVWGSKVGPALASLAWGEKAVRILVWWSRQATRPEYCKGGAKYATDEACRKLLAGWKADRTARRITEATLTKAAILAGWNGRPNASILDTVAAEYGGASG